ncbi:MAG TPA: ClcB-like voltage-gated chloride channel protein [Rariglobus sp.]
MTVPGLISGSLDPRALRQGLLRILRLRVWIAERLRPSQWQATLFWAALAGVLGALGSLAFKLGTEGIHQLLTGSTEGVVESFRIMPWWARLGVPALGGLLAGLVLMLGRRLTRDQSSTDYMEAIVIGTGRVPVRTSLVKIGAALFSIGSGGSIGREGPMVQLAAVLSSRLGRWRRFSPPQLRLLVACGASAGIASAYNAPIAGAFFVAEIILGSIAMESLGPLVAASVAAMLTIRTLMDVHALYSVPPFTLGSLWEMGAYLVLGLLAGTLAPWFLRSLRKAEGFFLAFHLPTALRLALGGLVVGALAIRVPEVCGNGYSVVLDILNGRVVWGWLVLVMACKWLATAASFGSGAPGGVFTPSLFMGASLGYLYGSLVHAFWPMGAADPQAFALVGMGAFLSAATHAPVMAVILLFEMTLSYDIILPLMACSVVAYYTARSLEGHSLYSEALKKKAAAQPVETVACVEQLMKVDPPRIPSNAPFSEIARMFLSVRVNNLYVTDGENRFQGVIALHDIKSYLNEPDLAQLVIAADIMREDFPRLDPALSIDHALGRFLGLQAERLPVVGSGDTLVGSLAKNDLLLAIEERLRRRASDRGS